MATPTELRVLTSQLEEGRAPGDWTRRTVERDVGIAPLKANFADFLQGVHQVFFQTLGEEAEFLLDEIRVGVDFDANGTFRLLGGSEIAHGGGLQLVLRRRRTENTADVQEHHLNTPHSPLRHALLGPSSTGPVEIEGPGGGRIPINADGKVDTGPGPLSVVIA